ncbi:neurotransmitter-gated ion-channel ligand binding domain-containing protein [Ditylenchus destructor]|nr:neurotransmitter-gated ion-channel ligand binding domain-containing protein [Ditylenchus destructor]
MLVRSHLHTHTVYILFCITVTSFFHRVIGTNKDASFISNEEGDLLVAASPMFPTNEDEERLVIDMFKGYNSLIRPSPCHNSTVVWVEFGVAMILLINVDEKNQIMQTNVWLTLKWNDCQFNWNPADYGGLESMRVPQERVWQPDIVLYNNADGNYEVSYHSNVVVDYQGNVIWVPPAIYKSSCRIDVEFFPFDEQVCALIFGSWTYNPNEVKLKWYNNKKSVELEDYSPSGIWDVIDVPGELIRDKSKIQFHIVIRRKTLFYTVILIIPTVLMAFLSMMVFYLPAECSEKITLAISILLALVVFLLLVSKILPPTSDTIPLMAKYLLLTFILNILTIMATVIIINIYFRSATTHTMPNCIRYIFLKLLPTLLMMKRPERIPVYNGYFVEEYCVDEIFDAILPFSQMGRRTQPQFPGSHHRNCSRLKQISKPPGGNCIPGKIKMECVEEISTEKGTDSTKIRFKPSDSENELSNKVTVQRTPTRSTTDIFCGKYTFGPSLKGNSMDSSTGGFVESAEYSHEQRISQELKSTVESIAYIAEHMKYEMSDKKIRDDWKYIAMVVDRLLLIIFFGITMGGTIGIIFSAPHVFDFVDQHSIIRRLIAESKLQAGIPT